MRFDIKYAYFNLLQSIECLPPLPDPPSGEEAGDGSPVERRHNGSLCV